MSQAVRAARPTYVYRCFDIDGGLVYVGCTFSPPQRLDIHRQTSWWWTRVATVRNLVFPDRDTALGAERRAIREERPSCNVKGRWLRGDSRREWSTQDYLDLHHATLRAATVVGCLTERLLRDVEAELLERFNTRPSDVAGRAA